VREEKPLAIALDSEPEPDVAVVAGAPRDYRVTHPATALLVVEVAETSLGYDRKTKGPLYARAGIPEYWIVNLLDGALEVYREPAEMPDGWIYRLIQRFEAADTVAPLMAPEAVVAVADLMP
jgi:Uma2 family endonuclease